MFPFLIYLYRPLLLPDTIKININWHHCLFKNLITFTMLKMLKQPSTHFICPILLSLLSLKKCAYNAFLCVQTISMFLITPPCEHIAHVDKWCLFRPHYKNNLIILVASDEHFVTHLVFRFEIFPSLFLSSSLVSSLLHFYSPQLNHIFL